VAFHQIWRGASQEHAHKHFLRPLRQRWCISSDTYEETSPLRPPFFRNASHNPYRSAEARYRQAQRGKRSSEMLRITLRRATSGGRYSEMRRITHTVQQKLIIGKPKAATVCQKYEAKRVPSRRKGSSGALGVSQPQTPRLLGLSNATARIAKCEPFARHAAESLHSQNLARKQLEGTVALVALSCPCPCI